MLHKRKVAWQRLWMQKSMSAKDYEGKGLWLQNTFYECQRQWVQRQWVYAKTMNVKIYDWKRLWVQKAVNAKTMNVKNYDYDCKSWWLKKDFDDYKILVHERLWVPMGKECQRPWLQKTITTKDYGRQRLWLQKNWKCKRPCWQRLRLQKTVTAKDKDNVHKRPDDIVFISSDFFAKLLILLALLFTVAEHDWLGNVIFFIMFFCIEQHK